MKNFVIYGDAVTPDYKPLSEKLAGSSLLNYFCIGLSIKFTVKTSEEARRVTLYTSDQYNNRDNKFSLSQEDSTTWTIETISGENGGPLSEAVLSESNFDDGAKFYLKFEIDSGLTKEYNYIFWSRNIQHNAVIFLPNRVNYNNIHPVLIGANEIDIDFFPFNKNDAGEKQYCGVETVQILDTPTALSGGDHVENASEAAIASISSIELPDRSSSDKITNYHTPPGFPDWSNYFHYVTFRFRSKEGSSNYLDFDTLLFAAAECSQTGA